MFKKVDPVKSAKPNTKGVFNRVESQLNLPKLEEEILRFWDENKIFEKSLELRKDAPLYTFYDGPPFATGTPHYGHIVGSIMKDVVPRYWTMKGKLVERKWGWDCHGLPIENIAEKELGIKSKKEIEEMGVDKFNEFCRSKILGYVEEWKKVIRRLGRWADMDNAYKTMDLDFMESVWWVFKQLYDKGLVYEGNRGVHICPRCETTLSQSEVAEGYKDIKDLSVIAKFELAEEPGTFLLAWTTTPWTLIGNVALAVGEKIKYVKIEYCHPERSEGSRDSSATPQNDKFYILAKDRLKDIFKDDEYTIIEELFGSDLVGKKYQPVFDFIDPQESAYSQHPSAFSIVSADFVDDVEGTGIVHIAPAFGEDDMNLGKKLNLPFIQHVGMDGIIKSGYGEFSGLSVKPAEDVQATDVTIIKYLAKKDLLFDKAQYEHSYPHCWRCETPLINYATSSWFVAVEKIKNKAIGLAKDINWTPKHIKNGRFGMWLEGARDWSISRQRFWASVIPIWKCDKCAEIKVIGSVKELEELSSVKVTDLHKHIVDKISFKCEKCNPSTSHSTLRDKPSSSDSKSSGQAGIMKRIPDVLDTWFDSGSMPYAQMHYPFDPSSISSQCSDNYGAGNKEKFDPIKCPPKNLPAEFIAEGVDMTRAWFYYLHVLSTAVMNKPAYKNVIVNGIVLAEDGKKMSKRLQNYPDPMEVFEKYGADVLRFYLLSSSVMVAENLILKEADLIEISRGIFRMLWSSYNFFLIYVDIDRWEKSKSSDVQSENILDRWIIAKLEQLNLDTNKNMENYNLVESTRNFQKFVDDLSNWYIRRSRKRFKSSDRKDKNFAYGTLYLILVKLSRLLAPFVPFVSEQIYKNLTGEESVHLADFPEADKKLINSDLISEMDRARKIVEIGLSRRAEAKIKVRQPLSFLQYGGKKLAKDFEAIIAEEVNVKMVENTSGGDENIVLDTNISPELLAEGKSREIIRSIQSLRKQAGFKINDQITTFYSTEAKVLKGIFSTDILTGNIKKETISLDLRNEKVDNVDCHQEFTIDGDLIWLGVRKTK